METDDLNSRLEVNVVNPLLTDFYQFSMIYAHWKNGRAKSPAVFDLYFRKCPFKLKSCIFGGLDECLSFLKNFKFTKDHIEYLKTQLPQAEEEFFEYLSNLDMKDIKIYGFQNGDYVLPNEPLLTLEGTLDKVQLVETTLLNLTNYPTLISSYTFRLREFLQVKILIEDGSVLAQSPYGAILGVKYSIISSANMTTNLLASRYYDLPLFFKTPVEQMSEFTSDDDFVLNEKNLIFKIKQEIGQDQSKINLNEIKNILYPIIVLNGNNKQSSFSFEIKNRTKLLEEIMLFNICFSAIKWAEGPGRQVFLILNYLESIEDVEEIIENLKKNNLGTQEISVFIRFNPNVDDNTYISKSKFYGGVILGPEYIVSSNQPALGMVYKINQIDGRPCMKFSEEKGKQTIPGYKSIIRLFSDQNIPQADFMCLREETDGFLNLRTIEAYLYNEFTEKHKVKFDYSKIMNNLIFSEGKVQYEPLSAMNLREKIISTNNHYSKKEIKLYISESIRNIIVEETSKLSEISKNN